MMKTEYIAKIGNAAKERLALQHRVFAPGTERLLEMAKFRPSMKVLIVGCGCGDETIMIAQKMVGHSGEIVAMDKSPEQIEQTRSEYATSLGIDFVEYYKAGYQFVIAGLEIEYRKPLGYKTEFYITVFTKSFDKNRMDFSQEIRRKSDDKLMATAMVHVACIDIKTRKSCMPDMLSQILEKETIAAAITDQGK